MPDISLASGGRGRIAQRVQRRNARCSCASFARNPPSHEPASPRFDLCTSLAAGPSQNHPQVHPHSQPKSTAGICSSTRGVWFNKAKSSHPCHLKSGRSSWAVAQEPAPFNTEHQSIIGTSPLTPSGRNGSQAFKLCQPARFYPHLHCLLGTVHDLLPPPPRARALRSQLARAHNNTQRRQLNRHIPRSLPRTDLGPSSVSTFPPVFRFV